jgi:ABC-type branched-subunit amino acid transport system substrate-binding protein
LNFRIKNEAADRNHRRRFVGGLAATMAAPGLVSRTFAASAGVSSRELLLGQTAVFSGPLGGPLKDFNAGAQQAFDQVNEAGGVAGRTIRLISIDDQLDPSKAVFNVKTLLSRDQVFAFFGAAGSASVAAIAPILRESNAPLIGNYAVPDGAREATRGAAYFVRATYSREIDRLLELLDVIGNTRIAIAYLGNPGGQSVLDHLKGSLTTGNPANELVAAAPVANDAHDAAAGGRLIGAAKPQAVILFVAGPPVVEVMKGVWETGASPLFFGMSVVAGELMARLLGPKLRNLTVAQVVPSPLSEVEPSAATFRKLRTQAKLPFSYYAYEGWINGLVMVEALRRCGANPTREGLHAAMRGMKARISDLALDFTDGKQTGSRFVELLGVRPDGSFVR